MKKAAKITSSVATAPKHANRKTGAAQAHQDTRSNRKLTLTRIAVSDVGDTKKALIAAIRAVGLPGNPANVARVQELRDEFDAARRHRRLNQVNAKTTKAISALPAPTGGPAIRLPLGTPATRLIELRRRTVTHYAQQVFRNGASGGTKFTVGFADRTSDVIYTTNLDRNYDVYRGAYKGWGANVDLHQICVPADWRLRVERKGLALLGGLMTLDALQIEAPAGIELYAAVWASQGRGYAVNTDRGFIAVADSASFHSDTAEGAISGLLRKGRSAPTRAATIADMKSAVNAFIAKYTSYDIDVSLDDARRSGSCEYGISSWCASVGIDIRRAQVPMVELLEGFRCMPQTEVRRAVLGAVKRAKRLNRLPTTLDRNQTKV
ncbi:hypothetical protein CLU90_2122 [Janthinobacterium sp. 67]|uniref:hypothetical protein n=1 Tax=Janthinobacterium sp. 67 TaxID=2035207 RepID=UPI000C2466F9|nr:hypothetical protein [Janthinobacterium sp. 67]PJJ18914.1 hypothetical protein CLU90_2122 [Janthinobacterium sp. 67]